MDKRFRKWSATYETAVLLVMFIVLFALLSNSFLSWFNIRNMLSQNTHLGVVVAGLSIVMICGSIDFSIGYQISLVSAVIGAAMARGIPLSVALIGGALTGMLCGAVNGVLIAYLRFAPYIATIITQMIFQGISYLISGGKIFIEIPAALRALTNETIWGIQFDVFLTVICHLLIEFVFHFTFFGRQVRAIGENSELAKRAGIHVRELQLACHMFSGLLYSLAAMILISRQSAVSSANGVGIELLAISAVLIGGCNIRFSDMRIAEVRLWNILLGFLVCVVIENGMLQIGATLYVQYLCIGAVAAFILIDDRQRSGSSKPVQK